MASKYGIKIEQQRRRFYGTILENMVYDDHKSSLFVKQCAKLHFQSLTYAKKVRILIQVTLNSIKRAKFRCHNYYSKFNLTHMYKAAK